MIKRETLDNGLELLIDTNLAYTCSLMVTVKVGTYNETRDENGISHVLEHMAFKGTKTKDGNTLVKDIERFGGDFNAWTGQSTTSYFASLSKQYWKEGLTFLKDIVVDSIFPEEELEKEKEVIIQELKQYDSDPNYILAANLNKEVFGDNSAGWRIIGTEENIRKFTREDLLNYHNKWYIPKNMIITVRGGAGENIEEIKAFVTELFGQLTNDNGQITERKHVDFIQNIHKSCEKEGITQSYIVLALPYIEPSSEWRHAAAVYTQILSGGMSTRLFQEVREKEGLAYSIDAGGDCDYMKNIFGIKAIVEPENEEVTIAKIKEVMLSMCEDITDEELEMARNLTEYTYANSLDNHDAIIYGMRQLVHLGYMLDLDKELESCRKVSKEDVIQFAKNMLKNEYSSYIVRPKLK